MEKGLVQKNGDLFLGIDVGGTAIKYALMNGDSEILEKGETPTPLTDLETYLDALESVYLPYKGNVKGIAMSAPGTIDSDRGYFYTGGTLNDFVQNLNLQELLEERFQIPVRIENDAKCAALAESWNGSLKGCSDAVVIVFGTGVGGGILKDGRIHKGRNFSAGELSFLIIGDDLAKDQSYMNHEGGTIGLQERAGKALGVAPETLDGRKIFEMANQGDERVIAAIESFTYPIARLIYNIQVFYDPEKIAIGGGISRQPLFLQMIQKNLDRIYRDMVHDVVIGQKAEVVCCEYLSDANLVGALRHFLLSMEGESSI